MKRTVRYMAFRRALSINLLRRAVLAFVYVYMCLFTGRFDSVAQKLDSVEVYNQYFATYVFLVHAL